MNESRSFESSDGTRLNVDRAGEGTPIVFQHGLCGDAGQTREAFPVVPGLCRITVEFRGHDHDVIHPIAYARELAERIPVARFVQITPKTESRAQYVADFRHAMSTFLKEL